jgi:hypothetical protein
MIPQTTIWWTWMSWLISMIRAGLCDCRGGDVKRWAENERPGAPEAERKRVRLEERRRELVELGFEVTPKP